MTQLDPAQVPGPCIVETGGQEPRRPPLGIMFRIPLSGRERLPGQNLPARRFDKQELRSKFVLRP